jgi:hypothetical protein
MALSALQISVRAVLEQIAQPSSHQIHFEQELVLDDAGGHYLILHVGWNDFERTYAVVVHIDIKDDFVWVQRDNTNYNVVQALLEQGIPKNRVVLGFHAPFKRQFTEYAKGNESLVMV